MSTPTLHLRWVDSEVLVQYPHKVEFETMRVLQQFHAHHEGGQDYVTEAVEGQLNVTRTIPGMWCEVPTIKEGT